MLTKLFSKSFKLGISSTWTENFQMNKLSLNETEEPEIIWTIFFWSWRKQGSSRKTSTSASWNRWNPLTAWITTNCEKFLKRLEHQIIFLVSWETYVLVKVVTEARVRTHGTTDWFKIGRRVWQGFTLSVQFSCSVMFDSLKPNGLWHTRPPCPSPTPWIYWNSCILSHWCHQIISSSVVPFSSHLQTFPTSGSFQMS